MQAVGIDFFQRGGHKYLLLMDNFLGMPLYRNTRNESGYSTNQLFFLLNWRDPKLPDLRAEPLVEEMVKARERVKGGCYKVK